MTSSGVDLHSGDVFHVHSLMTAPNRIYQSTPRQEKSFLRRRPSQHSQYCRRTNCICRLYRRHWRQAARPPRKFSPGRTRLPLPLAVRFSLKRNLRLSLMQVSALVLNMRSDIFVVGFHKWIGGITLEMAVQRPANCNHYTNIPKSRRYPRYPLRHKEVHHTWDCSAFDKWSEHWSSRRSVCGGPSLAGT